MTIQPSRANAAQLLNELREFASFSGGTQRYIRRSLDVGLGRGDALGTWSRNPAESASIRCQQVLYRDLDVLRAMLPEGPTPDRHEHFMGTLLRVTVHDLGQERLDSFSAFRFLYERLLGAEVRPWLPSAFCGGAALPQIRPERRKHLLQSISEAAATAHGWSTRQPCFYPEFVSIEEAA